MTKINIQPHAAKIRELLSAKRLRAAVEELRNVALTVRNNRVTAQANEIEENYNRLLGFMQSGADDPQRMTQYIRFCNKVYLLADSLERNYLSIETPSLYYGTLRYEATKSGDTVAELLGAYSKLINDSALFNLVAEESTEKKENTYQREMLERRLFNRLWVSFPLHRDTADVIRDFLASESIPLYVKQMIVSSLFLGLIEYFDDTRLALLWETYSAHASSEPALALQAMTCAVIVNMMYPGRPVTSQLESVIESATAISSWESDLRLVLTEFVRSIDTERINRKMQQEVMPELMKLQPDLKRINTEITSVEDLADLEENPEWQEKLSQSGLADKLRSLSKIQEEGGDVFMSTFAHLKAFPYFNEIANWFIPFHTDHTLLTDADEQKRTIADIIMASPFLCDSDKYSFLLSLNSIPASQRDMMLSQMKVQNINADEIRSAALNATVTDRRNIVNKFVQNLYRFFKLFRRKNEFRDPFDGSLSVADIPALVNKFNDTDTLSLVAEFYFKHHYYAEGLAIFLKLEQRVVANVQLYQKIGFCYLKLNDYENALKYFRMSELLDARSVWTRKNIAYLLFITGNFAEAEEYYAKLEEVEPDNIQFVINLGNCRMALHDYAGALKAFHKVNYINKNDIRALRAIAWCHFMLGDYNAAIKTYRTIMLKEPEAEDYINMGHLALATNDYAEAVNSYNLAVERMDNDREKVIARIMDDVTNLDRVKINTSVLPFIIDSLY
ncbi:MAG: tetratricopeptide repeat protein [Muribaculaceae bacterium]|nr:tetratricopeptide repeat protein [Muribaculaceae bacterium]